MIRKALVLCILILPVLVTGCSNPSATPTAVPSGNPSSPAGIVTATPTAAPVTGPGLLIDNTLLVAENSYATYRVPLDYQKSINITIKTDGSPIDCFVIYEESLQAYKDNVAGTTTYFGYQKLYPNVIDESNVYTSLNSNQAYYIVIDNTGKAGEANAGRDVSVHTLVEQL